MSLLHSRPVAAQRTNYKPSAMSRLKAMFSSNHHQHHHSGRPRTAATAAPRRTGRRRVAKRQPARKTGLFHRSSPRRTGQRRTGFLDSLKPRHSSVTGSGRGHKHNHDRHKNGKHHNGHKGSILAALLAVFALKKKHEHDRDHREKQ